jgi:aerobic-type carbon monoxide dehydrogenase small subunit (CoxS/CutS family)
MANQLTLHVNGSPRTVSAPAETPLLYVLRNDLQLTGPRLGCGMAQCGACAVLVDGHEVRSCITPVSAVVGKQVTTIEGLPAVWAAAKGLQAENLQAGGAKTLHPVQQAWIEEQVPQCGYCQNGQIMTAAALLGKNPTPTDAQIRQGMAGTLCRCMTYYRIQAAIKRASKAIGSASADAGSEVIA